MTYAVLSRIDGGQLASFDNRAEALRYVMVELESDDNDWALVWFGDTPGDNRVIAIPTNVEPDSEDGLR